MSAYVIARMTITDPERYDAYKAVSPGVIAAHGGRFLARGGQVQTLEGEPETHRVVIIEFSTVEAAQAFYRSAEYTAAKEIRRDAADFQMILVEGFAG